MNHYKEIILRLNNQIKDLKQDKSYKDGQNEKQQSSKHPEDIKLAEIVMRNEELRKKIKVLINCYQNTICYCLNNFL